MELKDYIIVLVLASVVMLGYIGVLYDTGNSKYYQTNFSSDYDDIYNSVNSTMLDFSYDLAINGSQNLEETSGVTVTESFAVLTNNAITALKLPFTAMKVIPKLISAIAVKIGVPAWEITALITLLIVSLIFLVLSYLLRWR